MALLVLWLLSLITFALANLAPGDPARQALEARGVEPTERMVEQTRQRLGLDEVGPVRYLRWLGSFLSGDLGISYATGESVWHELATRLPATLVLALSAFTISTALALPLGVLSAVRQGSLLDWLARLAALAGAAVPGFWLGLLLITWLAVELRLFPTSGYGTPQHLVLPALTLAAGHFAFNLRLLRAGMLAVLPQLYIGAARGRGIGEWALALRHALPNALLPLLTALGMQLAGLLGGAAIVETVFAWPGIGQLAVGAIYGRDYPLLQGFVMLSGTLVVTFNLLVDFSYALLDPRVRLGAAHE